MIATFGVLILAAGVLLWYWSAYNSLVNARNSVNQSWSNVEVELKRRLDLLTNLIAVVKGYAKHESETLENTVRARNSATSFKDAAQSNDAERELKQASIQLFALAEAYPDLKAQEQFARLQTELIETENRIAERRSAYNQTVTVYSNLCHTVPSNFVASTHAFETKAFFDAPDEEVAQVPEVKFP